MCQHGGDTNLAPKFQTAKRVQTTFSDTKGVPLISRQFEVHAVVRNVLLVDSLLGNGMSHDNILATALLLICNLFNHFNHFHLDPFGGVSCQHLARVPTPNLAAPSAKVEPFLPLLFRRLEAQHPIAGSGRGPLCANLFKPSRHNVPSASVLFHHFAEDGVFFMGPRLHIITKSIHTCNVITNLSIVERVGHGGLVFYIFNAAQHPATKNWWIKGRFFL